MEADPRLQDPVPFDHAALHRVEAGLIQRVRQRADQPLGRVARQLGVGVERDDEAGRAAVHAGSPLRTA